MNFDDIKKYNPGKIGVILEILGMAIILTVAQITVFHIIFADFMVSKYINFYQDYIKNVDIFYRILIIILTKIFGNSYTVSLYNFIEKFFVPIFITNLIYFTIRFYKKGK
jgi:hypothetical protein